MRLIKLQCDNCGAMLDVDLDNLQVYCQYCGQKLAIDMKRIDRVFVEKEKTKQIQEQEYGQTRREEEKTNRLRLKYEYRERSEKRSINAAFMLLGVVLLITLISIPFIYKMERDEAASHLKNNELMISVSSDDLDKQYYVDVRKKIEEAGFENVVLKPIEDVKLGLFVKDETVESVSIDGDKTFSANDWFPRDAEVVIEYHVKKK